MRYASVGLAGLGGQILNSLGRGVGLLPPTEREESEARQRRIRAATSMVGKFLFLEPPGDEVAESDAADDAIETGADQGQDDAIEPMDSDATTPQAPAEPPTTEIPS